MNQIEAIKEIPDWTWMVKSQEEMTLAGSGIIEQTDFMWRVGNVAVAGFIYYSFLSPPAMWFALAKDVTIRDLVDFRKIAELIPQGTITLVEDKFTTGLRFAKLYGFKETGDEETHFDKTYKIMRRA